MGTIFKGWNAKIFLDALEIGCCESASVDVTQNIDSYYCIGTRTPYAVVPGNLEITGSLSRVWINTYYLNLLIGSGDTIPDFTLVFKASTEAGAPWIYCYKCRFESGTIDIPQDGFLTEDYDFRAESIATVVAP